MNEKTILFSDELKNYIEKISRETNLTQSGIFKNALALFIMAYEESREGNFLGIFDKNDQIIKEIKLF